MTARTPAEEAAHELGEELATLLDTFLRERVEPFAKAMALLGAPTSYLMEALASTLERMAGVVRDNPMAGPTTVNRSTRRRAQRGRR